MMFFLIGMKAVICFSLPTAMKGLADSMYMLRHGQINKYLMVFSIWLSHITADVMILALSYQRMEDQVISPVTGNRPKEKMICTAGARRNRSFVPPQFINHCSFNVKS